MKKIITLVTLICFLLLLVPSFALAGDVEAQRQFLLKKRNNVVAYKNSLQSKLSNARRKARILKLRKMVNAQNARIKRIDAQINALPPMVKPAVRKDAPKVIRRRVAEKPKPMPKKTEAPYEIGGGIGLMAGLTGLRGELVIKEPLGIMEGSALLLGAGYGQAGEGQDSALNNNRKVAFIYGGGSLDLTKVMGLAIPGVDKTCVVGRINYMNLTSGQYHGEIGGDIGVSLEKMMDPGVIFGEIGYGKLRTGFSPSFSSVNFLVGYKLGFAL